MADIAHSTPTSDVHPLTGSSAPGSISPNFSSVSEMPSAFMSLGASASTVVAHLAGRRAGTVHPDAELIDLADRVKSLCLRHRGVERRVLAIQERLDLWSFAHRPMSALRTGTSMVCERSKTDTHSIMVITEPLEADDQRQRDVIEHQAAVDAHKARTERRRARTRAPYLAKLSLRMWCRYVRWTSSLSVLMCSTAEGLAAKAAVYQLVADMDADTEWGFELARSVADDAVRIAIGRAHGVASPDPDLLALIASHAPALEAAAEAEVVLTEARARFDAEEPKRPDALYFRFDDPASMPSGRVPSANGFRMVYTDAEIEDLRVGPYPQMLSSGAVDSPEGPGMAFRPDPRRAARKAAILAAHDAWKAERRVVAESTGWKAANVEHVRLSREAREIEDAILEAPTQSLADVQAKAYWIEQQDMVEEWSYFVLYDVIGLDTPATILSEDAAPSTNMRAA